MCVNVTQHLKVQDCLDAFSSHLKTHKRQSFPMITPLGVAKLSISPKVAIFPPPVTYYFISDQCLKGGC